MFYLKNRLHSLYVLIRDVRMNRDWSKLRRWLTRRKLEGYTVTAICAEAQVDRKMFYRWWSRYQAEGWKGLEEKPKGCPSDPRLGDSLKEKVVKLRERYG
jgi:transposase